MIFIDRKLKMNIISLMTWNGLMGVGFRFLGSMTNATYATFELEVFQFLLEDEYGIGILPDSAQYQLA